jgi:hypothetical protein
VGGEDSNNPIIIINAAIADNDSLVVNSFPIFASSAYCYSIAAVKKDSHLAVYARALGFPSAHIVAAHYHAEKITGNLII